MLVQDMDFLGLLIAVGYLFWAGLQWIVTNFWWLLIIVFLAYKWKGISLTFLKWWNLFMNAYNNSYPAFSRFQIGSTNNDLLIAYEESNNTFNQLLKLKEKAHGKKFDSKIQEKIKEIQWEHDQTSKRWETLRKKLTFMIEGNIAVSNGKTTIEKVQGEYNKLF